MVACYFAALAAALTTPVTDPDFWWRLASGRWILERGELMRADPFAFTSATFAPTGGEIFHFRQSWLAELLLYWAHARAGLAGVVLLRTAVLTLMFLLLYRLLRRVGAGQLAAVLLVSLADRAIVNELGYIGDRPQLWSSLLFVAALLLGQLQREGRRFAFVGLPLTMLLWSNLHGGYLLGLAVVAATTAAAFLGGRADRRAVASAGASLLLCGCNPAGFSVLLSYTAFRASGSAVFQKVTEEMSLLRWVGWASAPRLVPALAALLALALLALLARLKPLARERPDLLALWALTLAMGASSSRFLIFLIGTSAVLAAAGLPVLLRERLAPVSSFTADSWFPAVRAAGFATVLVALAAQQAAAAVRTSALRPGATWRHPYERVADFLEQSGVRGNVFNEYGAGGYLVWRLSPGVKVFIYGRVLSGDQLVLYEDLLLNPAAPAGDGPRYRRVFDEHRVDAVVVPTCDANSGMILPLAVVVSRDPDWALVYSDPTAVVLVRRSAAPDGLLARTLPPTALYDNMIAIASQTGRSFADLSRNFGGNVAALAGQTHRTGHRGVMPAWRYSMAFALYAKGEREAALAFLDEYLKLAPAHEAARLARERIVRELAAGVGAASGTAPAASGSGSMVHR